MLYSRTLINRWPPPFHKAPPFPLLFEIFSADIPSHPKALKGQCADHIDTARIRSSPMSQSRYKITLLHSWNGTRYENSIGTPNQQQEGHMEDVCQILRGALKIFGLGRNKTILKGLRLPSMKEAVSSLASNLSVVNHFNFSLSSLVRHQPRPSDRYLRHCHLLD